MVVTQWQYAELYWHGDVVGRGVWWVGPGGDSERLGTGDGLVHLNRAGEDGWEVIAVTETRLRLFGYRRMRKYTLRRPSRG